MCFKKLPKWIIPTTPASFDDKESGTSVEMVGRIYKKMNELVDSYNQFVEDLNSDNADFKTSINEVIETFTVGLRQEFQDFIDTITLEYEHFKTTAKDEIIKDAKDQLDMILANTIQSLEETINNCEQQLEDKANNLEQQLDEHVENKIAEGIPPEIFIAEYNVTTFEEIHTAFLSGIQVFVKITQNTGDIAGAFIVPLTLFQPSYNYVSFNAIYTAPTGVTSVANVVLNNGVWNIDYIHLNNVV